MEIVREYCTKARLKPSRANIDLSSSMSNVKVLEPPDLLSAICVPLELGMLLV